MKHLQILAAVLGLAAANGQPATATSGAQQTLKLGKVDSKKVFEGCYKTKEAEAQIKEARGLMKKEVADRAVVYDKGAAELKRLSDDLDTPGLSPEVREEKRKLRDQKEASLKVAANENELFRAAREKQIQEKSTKLRGEIVDRMNKAVQEFVKARSYILVFDTSNGPNGLPDLKTGEDFTADLIAELNKEAESK